MLVKIEGIKGNKVRVTELDIDSYGSIIPLRNLELKLPDNDDSIVRTLRSSSHVESLLRIILTTITVL